MKKDPIKDLDRWHSLNLDQTKLKICCCRCGSVILRLELAAEAILDYYENPATELVNPGQAKH